jgi:hyaluronate lyase
MRVRISRTRAIAHTVAAAALTAALTLVGAPAAHAAADHDTLRQTWTDMLTGGSTYNPSDPDIATRIGEIDATAQSWWDSLNTAPGRTYLWSDLTSTTVSAQVTAAYTRLKAMALAARTHGSQFEGDQSLIDAVVGGLDWMNANRYNTTVPAPDNWWDWEIGAPIALDDTVVLLYDHLAPAQITAYMDAVNRFSPSVVYTGANRAWKAKVVAVSGLIIKDSAKLTNARNGLSQTFDYVTSGDGFNRDGSFIQHGWISYTGSYGRSLLVTLAELLALLDGSAWEVVDADVANVYNWVPDAFEPVMYQGAIMDMVRGREITRYYSQDHDAGHSAIEAILALAESAPPALAASYQRMVKEWLTADTYRDFSTSATIPSILRAQSVLADTGIAPRGDLNIYHQYANMDRAVVHRPGWSLGLAMSSNRIGLYESANSENLHGWYTGVGTTYLYDGDLGYYSDGYWPTVDPYRLPGTTVDVQTRANGANNTYLSPRNWVGGAELADLFGATGMDYQDASSDLVAHKSWFMFDDEVVALGAGITSTSGRTIQTTVDNRKLNSAGSNAVRVDGVLQSTSLTAGTTTVAGVDRIHVDGSVTGSEVGYYFPTPVTINSLRQARTGSWSQVDGRPTAPTNPMTRNYETLWLSHGANPTNATYAYALLPGSSSTQVDAYAAAPDFTVLANTATAQGVEEQTLGIQAVNFFTSTPATVGMVSSNARASVLTREQGGELEVAVSDPTQSNSATIQLEIARSAGAVLALDAGMTVTQLSPTIKITVNTAGADGKTFTARFGPASSSWNVVLDGMGDWSGGWTAFGTPTPVVQNSGYVTVTDASTTTSANITYDGFVPPVAPFTMEARIRAVSGLAGFSARGADFLVKADLLAGTSGAVRDATGTRSFTLDTTVYHTYRMVVHVDHTYDMYVDGNLVWSDAPPGAGGTNILLLGLGAPQTGVFDVDDVRVGRGEMAP